jgi:hypothetical protein
MAQANDAAEVTTGAVLRRMMADAVARQQERSRQEREDVLYQEVIQTVRAFAERTHGRCCMCFVGPGEPPPLAAVRARIERDGIRVVEVVDRSGVCQYDVLWRLSWTE